MGEQASGEGVIRRMARRVLGTGPQRDTHVTCGIDFLNLWQEGFCAWNAERLGISDEESRHRYRASWQALPDGHNGASFRRFTETQIALFSVIANDSVREIHDAYRLHDWLFMLRQVSLPVPIWRDDHPIMMALRDVSAPVIADFGCGLAQTSISLALTLRQKDAAPKLVLADLPTMRLEFLSWLCRRLGLAYQSLPCTRIRPLPELPSVHVAICNDVFSHLHDPMAVLEHLNTALLPGGFLLTSFEGGETEILRTRPDLIRLHHRLASLGYIALDRQSLFRKPAAVETLPAATAPPGNNLAHSPKQLSIAAQ
jgi:SAM-dependent methyltransferase